MLARLVEPTSKLDSFRLIGELGLSPVHLSTVKRYLKRCAVREHRDQVAIVVCRASLQGVGEPVDVSYGHA